MIDPLVGSALVSGGAGLLGNIMSNASNKKAAKIMSASNEKIAQMNNEWSAEQAAINRDWQSEQRDAQNQWNLDQWNRENEYNSASSQRKRLEEAGLNPYNMMSGDAGTAGSVTSSQVNATDAPTAQPYQHIEPHYQYDFSSIADAINSYYQNENVSSDTVRKGLDNSIIDQFGKDEARARIGNLLGGNYEWLTSTYQNGRKNAAFDLLGAGISKTMKEVDSIDSYIEMNYAKAFSERMSGRGQEVLNKYLDASQQAELAIKAASQYRLLTEGKLNEATVKQRIASSILTEAKTKGQKISNRVAEQTAASVISSMNEEHMHKARYYSQLRKYARALANNDANLSNIEKDLKQLEYDKKFSRTQSYGKLNQYYNAINDVFKVFKGQFDK